MTDTLSTVASFSDLLQADLARNDLQAAGIEAFLVGEAFASVAWHLTNAAHGIRLQVPTADVERARAILAAPTRHHAEGEVDQEPAWEEKGQETVEDEDSTDEPEEPTRRDDIADRAFRGAALGLIFLPLQLYVFWLLLKVIASEERLSRRSRKRAVWAAVINVPFIFLVVVWVASLVLRRS